MDISSLIFPVITLSGLGLIFGLGLGYASKKFKVEVDERIPLVKECLPGANCGGCGYAGCEAFAQAIVEEGAPANACAVANPASIEKIGEIIGKKVEASDPMKATVKCVGTCESAKKSGSYYGVRDCNEAAVIPGGGDKACSYGCLGFGSCVKECKFDAIHIIDGIAVVDQEKCIGCGACAKICPKNVIEIKPVSHIIRVNCNSKDKLKDVKSVCSTGCIGCGVCSKLCTSSAITMENNLPVIDHDKCNLCMTCVGKCPTKVLKAYETDLDKVKIKVS